MFAIDGGVTKPLVNTNVWSMSSLGCHLFEIFKKAY